MGGGADFFAMNSHSETASPDNRRIDVVKEALRHTELRLQDLEALASNADRRAAAFTATSAAIAAILVTNGPKALDMPTVYIAAVLCLIAGAISFWSMMPKQYHVRGHYFRDRKGHIDEGDTLEVALLSQAEENDERIDFNETVLLSSANSIRSAFILLITTLTAVLAVQILVFFGFLL